VVEGAVWVMGKGHVQSCTGAFGVERFLVRGYWNGAIICVGSTWQGFPKLGEYGGSSILCLAGSLTLLGGNLQKEPCSAPSQLCSQKRGAVENFLGIDGVQHPEQGS
jgi:hypothetical protein